MKKAVIAVALSVLVALLSANVNTVAHAQGELVAPSNVAAQNTANPGEVRISWDAVPDAAYYRIGWVAYADVEPIIAAGGDWLEHFAFIDIENRGQTQRTITRLTPGVQYAFIMASNDGRYGTPRWPTASGWAFLTLNEAPATQASLGSTAVNLTWSAVPGAAYYRIGWVVYADVAPIIEAGGDWLEHFAFIDIANRGQTEHTIARLTPGLQYAFIVAGNEGRYGTPQWPDASGWQFMTPGAGQPDTQQPDTGHSQLDQPACPMPGRTVSSRPMATVRGDYDADDDGLIEVASLAQLDAMRYDPDGEGSPSDADLASYFGEFPNAVAGMGCLDGGCTGYELVADLDFDTNGNGRADSGDAYWNNGAGWIPFDFGGTFQGGGHTITHLFINQPEATDLGLFRNSRGIIRSAALASISVAGASNVGGLVGSNHGEISDSCTMGTVSASDTTVGVLVGANWGSISGSYATGDVSGGSRAGGLVGSNSGKISDSYAAVTVTGLRYVGGLIGNSDGGNIHGSHATGAVSGSRIGGLVGDNASDIGDSFATGDVSSDFGVAGGLVGSNHTGRYSGGNISDSYATGNVSGQSSVGGLVGGLIGTNVRDAGLHTADVSRSYATGSVSYDGKGVGGLIGENRGGNIDSSYATGTVSGRTSVGGLIGSNDRRFDRRFSAGHAGAITNSNATGEVSSTGDDVGGLVGSNRGGAIGASHATGRVSGGGNVGGLVGFNRPYQSASASISESYATGTVSGRGNGVGGLVGSNSGGRASITYLWLNAAINDSYATGTVSGNSDFVGGLVGYNGGGLYSRTNVVGCFAMGTVTGGSRVGGLIGYNHGGGGVNSSSDVISSYAAGSVSGNGDNVGGLVGDNFFSNVNAAFALGPVSGGANKVGGLLGNNQEGNLSATYAVGSISGNFRVGGLVGHSDGGSTVTSYAAGKVSGQGLVGGLVGSNTGDVTYSYWDTVTSGQSHSDGGQGQTTSELQSPTEYTGIYADWNAGNEDPWDFGTSSQYPVLKVGALSVAEQRR